MVRESAPRRELVLKLFCPAVRNDIITGRVYCAILLSQHRTFFRFFFFLIDTVDHATSYWKGEFMVSVFLVLAIAPGACIQNDLSMRKSGPEIDLNSCQESVHLMG